MDHDHLTGKYRGAAYKNCNLNYKIPKFIPVIFHNLTSYDADLFIKILGVTKGKTAFLITKSVTSFLRKKF